MKILDGRLVSQKLLERVAAEVEEFSKEGKQVKLAVVLVGDNPASESYVNQKMKACKKAHVQEEIIRFTADEVTTESLIHTVESLNNRDDVHGFIVQLPLPDHIDVPQVIRAITPEKDVDGFHAYNIGKMFLSSDYEHLAPCTAKGVIRMLEHYDIDLRGKDVCMVGASNVVGKPIAMMMTNRGATVSLCHIDTKDVAHYTKYADIMVVAVGKPNLITPDMVKDGVIVVDVGINRLENGKLVGDADFDGISEKCDYISPVPGGVGPMTVACLIENTLTAFKRQNNIPL